MYLTFLRSFVKKGEDSINDLSKDAFPFNAMKNHLPHLSIFGKFIEYIFKIPVSFHINRDPIHQLCKPEVI